VPSPEGDSGGACSFLGCARWGLSSAGQRPSPSGETKQLSPALQRWVKVKCNEVHRPGGTAQISPRGWGIICNPANSAALPQNPASSLRRRLAPAVGVPRSRGPKIWPEAKSQEPRAATSPAAPPCRPVRIPSLPCRRRFRAVLRGQLYRRCRRECGGR
jgi:hypothetical protein